MKTKGFWHVLIYIFLALVLAGGILLAACGGGSGEKQTPTVTDTPTATPAKTSVSTATPTITTTDTRYSKVGLFARPKEELLCQ
jgi:carbohydrate-binding DOMON domain-containing protein